VLLQTSQPAPFIGVTCSASSWGIRGLDERCGRQRIRLLAVGAHLAHEPLGADEVHGARDENGSIPMFIKRLMVLVRPLV